MITPEEMSDRGMKALNSSDYATTEQLFLSILQKYSDNDLLYYRDMLGAIDQLALFIYPIKGNLPDSDRALKFYTHLSPTDKNASLGYAKALINGVFESNNYSEAIRQLSKVYYDQQLYTIAYLLHNGFGLEKDDKKAKSLLMTVHLKGNKKALELSKSIGNIEERPEEFDEKFEEELEKTNREIIEEIYRNEYWKLSLDDKKSRNQAIKEFFTDIHFTPL